MLSRPISQPSRVTTASGSVERLLLADDSIDFGTHTHSALTAAEELRNVRKEQGHIKFTPEKYVPDFGGVGMKTRTGHVIKNQSYYAKPPGTNDWDLPTHAGPNTWKAWHGPKLRNDAPMMERLDRFNEEEDQWDAKKKFVNTTRAQTLDRFYNRKLTRDQLEAAPSWAPHRRAKREVHNCHEHFFSDMDAKPEKELKKVLTAHVLEKDQWAGHQIATRIQQEDTWKLAWKNWERERRNHIRADFKHRQHYNDCLMHASGQPVKTRNESTSSLNNCSQRTDELAGARPNAQMDDITKLTDFRGLWHADNEHALEAMFPGSGHEQSQEFKLRSTEQSRGDWPPKPKKEFEPHGSVANVKGRSRESAMLSSTSLTTEKVPIADARLQNVAARTNDHVMKQYSKAQFKSTEAPPPPPQKKQLLAERWSPSNTPCDTKYATGTFARTEPGSPSASALNSRSLTMDPRSSKELPTGSMEHLPPPHRPYTYSVMAPVSPNARGAQALQYSDASSSPINGLMKRSASTPGSIAETQRRKSGEQLRFGYNPQSEAVCKELETFESSLLLQEVPRLSNFYNTPRATKRKGSKAIASQASSAQE